MSFTGYKNLELLTEIKKYTDFEYDGQSAKIPYFMSNNGIYGGKKTVSEIKKYISANKGSERLQSFIDSHKPQCGIDCSGFCYNTLNEATDGKLKRFLRETADTTDVTDLRSKSTKITTIEDIRPNDFIIFNGDNHVAIIYEVRYSSLEDGISKPWQIKYAHSSGGKGPHFGYIVLNSNKLKGYFETIKDFLYSKSI